MLDLQPLDSYVDHATQLTDIAPGPVVLVNILHVHPSHGDDLAAYWAELLQRFRTQPGFISAQFHRGTAGSGTFLNYALWESVEDYRRAFNDPDFTSRVDGYPEGTVATPHLFTEIAVPNVRPA